MVALVRRVALSVQQETGGEQRPELSLAVPFEFYFKPGPPQPPPTVQQLLPNAKPHEIGAIESQIDAIVGAASEQDRAQIRRELMALVSEMVSRSGLKPDQLATELPNAFARLAKMRKEIEEFRRLMENEPGIAPVRRDRRGGRRVGPQAATCRRPIRRWPRRRRATTRPSARAPRRSIKHAATARPCPSSAATSPRPNIARRRQRSSISRRQRTRRRPTSRMRRGGTRWPEARCSSMASNFFANDELREAIRLLESEALPASSRSCRRATSTSGLVVGLHGDRARQHRRRADQPRRPVAGI